VTETNKPENPLPAIPYKANLNPGVAIQFSMGVPLGTIGEGTSAPHYLVRRGTTMRTMTALLLIGLVAGSPAQAAAPGYHLLKTVPLPGDGGWDYVTVDSAARRVYVSHGTEVIVLDADTCEVKGKITDLKGVHGIAVAPDLGRGFISTPTPSFLTLPRSASSRSTAAVTMRPSSRPRTARSPALSNSMANRSSPRPTARAASSSIWKTRTWS
jgi:hypothetical protein